MASSSNSLRRRNNATWVRRRAESDVRDESLVRIAAAADIVTARQQVRALASSMGFSGGDLTVVVTAISELAHNIIEYGTTGEIMLGQTDKAGRSGVIIIARNHGAGIPDVAKALNADCSSGQCLGLGLPGVRHLMDEFEISSKLGEGTTVTVKKWLP